MSFRRDLCWEIAEGASVGDLWHELQDAYPNMPQVRPAAAINAEYARLDEPLQAGDEVAFLPPVSGGGSWEYRPAGWWFGLAETAVSC